jgi:hypothetical protein
LQMSFVSGRILAQRHIIAKRSQEGRSHVEIIQQEQTSGPFQHGRKNRQGGK